MPSNAFTISKLADAVGVNIETVRYYQRRGILDEPKRVNGSFRAYDETHLQRLRFIKRAQELGFPLDDVAELLSLSASVDRKRLREVARMRAADIRRKMAHLESMASALEHLAENCARTAPHRACPIVAALNEPAGHEECHPHRSRSRAAIA